MPPYMGYTRRISTTTVATFHQFHALALPPFSCRIACILRRAAPRHTGRHASWIGLPPLRVATAALLAFTDSASLLRYMRIWLPRYSAAPLPPWHLPPLHCRTLGLHVPPRCRRQLPRHLPLPHAPASTCHATLPGHRARTHHSRTHALGCLHSLHSDTPSACHCACPSATASSAEDSCCCCSHCRRRPLLPHFSCWGRLLTLLLLFPACLPACLPALHSCSTTSSCLEEITCLPACGGCHLR